MRANEVSFETKRHSLSHILAAAVIEMFPEGKLGIGPSIENGFYYDFDLPRTLIPEDLPLIEKKMRALIAKDLEFEKAEVKIDEAIERAKKSRHDLKLELLQDLKKEGTKSVSFYKTGDFVDLCKGPHVESTEDLKGVAFKLDKIAGAYWKGDEKNKMLQRIYALAFESEKELDKFLVGREEAAMNDHRKLGQELDLFFFSDLIGPGLPLFTPKGTLVKELLQKKVESICKNYGFQKVMTPHLAKIRLYEISGHAEKFSDELFSVTSKRNQDYVIRPVLCPHQTQIYASKLRSYRELPIRYMESDRMYRAEKPGEISGLSRVIAITVEDGHSFCRVDQVKQEIKNMVRIIKDFYLELGMWGDHRVFWSVRDYNHPEKYIGEPEDWDECENILKEVSDELRLNAQRHEGEAALYGPKLDFIFKDALGREIQIPTVQVDFATPKRFKLTYVNEKGKEENPVMVHRAILGSYERFIALLLEHYAGAFPVWLAPIQAVVLPISDKHKSYAQKITDKLKEAGIRAEADLKSETIGRKIREAELQKIPYMVVVGDKEVTQNKVSVRKLGEGDKGQSSVGSLIKEIKSSK